MCERTHDKGPGPHRDRGLPRDRGSPYDPHMGVQGPGESVAKIIGRPIPSHPLAVPPIPGTFGVWQVRRVRESPIGYVLMRSEDGQSVYHCYAHGRDDNGGRPWLQRAETLNSAVAWLVQHEGQLVKLSGTLHPEPEEWPA